MVKSGDKISLHYKGTLNDGTVFDSSVGREPLEFIAGSGQVIPGFDAGVMGMTVGEKKTINIPCKEAYGEVNEENRGDFPRTQLPPDMAIEVGMELEMTDDSGESFPVVVIAVQEDTITIDANHPLAGQDLNFDLELVSIG